MSTKGTEEKMTSHESGLEEAEAHPPAKLHHPKEELEWLGNMTIGEEALKPQWSLTLDEEVEEKALGITYMKGSHRTRRWE